MYPTPGVCGTCREPSSASNPCSCYDGTEIHKVYKRLVALKAEMNGASTRGEELNAWAKWCRTFDKKEALENAARSKSEAYEL